MSLKLVNGKRKRAIMYCRSVASDNMELHNQQEKLINYAEMHGYSITEIFLESGEMDPLTYHSLRLRAKYNEFDILLISDLESLGNSPIEITHEVSFLVDSGLKIISFKEGEINVESLPSFFRQNFRFVK